MGSFIEMNDTLQLTSEQGFPAELQRERHREKPFTAEQFHGRRFSFTKPGMRLYHSAPTRVILVHNIDGKWLYWGHCHVFEQTIHAETKMTTGVFGIVMIYPPDYQDAASRLEPSPGKQFSS
ncbi:MAG: hypothetical protein HY341_01960 [Candidatus Kerfeldbacteria bacterium]|nr:hypothetical protein [Candidatus Kerfeldbacteria bacterium]